MNNKNKQEIEKIINFFKVKDFKKVIEFIDSLANNKNKFNKEKAKKTILSCNFENLQNLEKNEGFSEALTKKNSKEKIKFFNLGKKNDYRMKIKYQKRSIWIYKN